MWTKTEILLAIIAVTTVAVLVDQILWSVRQRAQPPELPGEDTEPNLYQTIYTIGQDIRGIMFGLSDINSSIDSMDRRIKTMVATLADLNAALDAQDNALTGIVQALTALNEEVTKVQAEVSDLKNNLPVDYQAQVDRINTQLAKVADIATAVKQASETVKATDDLNPDEETPGEDTTGGSTGTDTPPAGGETETPPPAPGEGEGATPPPSETSNPQ